MDPQHKLNVRDVLPKSACKTDNGDISVGDESNSQYYSVLLNSVVPACIVVSRTTNASLYGNRDGIDQTGMMVMIMILMMI